MNSKSSVSTLLININEYDKLGDFHNMLSTAQQLLAKDPHNGEYMLYQLKALEGLGSITKHLSTLENYANVRSTDVTAFVLLYRAYIERNDIGSAIIALAFALSVDPNDEECLNLLISVLKEVDPKYTRVKINIITTPRIGHLACEIEPLFRQKEGEGENHCLYLFIYGGSFVANHYLFNVLKGMAHVIENKFLFNLFASRPTLLDDFFYAEFPYDLTNQLRGVPEDEINTNGINNLVDIYNKHPICTEIPSSDKDKAWSLLSEYGIKKEDKLVTFHIRDSAYLSEKFRQRDFSYHNFRDADIATYLPAIEYLIAQGYKVCRIGADTNQELAINSPSYFDFCVNRDEKNGDFLEVFLIAESEFMLASSSGPYGIAAMFDIPTLITNIAPYSGGYSKYGRYIPKKIMQHGQLLNFMDVCNGQTLSPDSEKPILLTFSGETFSKHGISYIDNSVEELLEATIEFEKIVKDKIIDATFTREQLAHQALLPENYIYKRSNIVISDCFLNQNKELFC